MPIRCKGFLMSNRVPQVNTQLNYIKCFIVLLYTCYAIYKRKGVSPCYYRGEVYCSKTVIPVELKCITRVAHTRTAAD